MKQIIKTKISKFKVFLIREKLETKKAYLILTSKKSNLKQREQAKQHFKEWRNTLFLLPIIILPGSVITVPILIKFFKKYNIDITPKDNFKED